MKESYGEGVASHTDPESCTGLRKEESEALTGARTGPVWSREIVGPPKWWGLLGADALLVGGRLSCTRCQRETCADPARSETRHTYETLLRGNREVRWLSGHLHRLDRIGKSKDTRR